MISRSPRAQMACIGTAAAFLAALTFASCKITSSETALQDVGDVVADVGQLQLVGDRASGKVYLDVAKSASVVAKMKSDTQYVLRFDVVPAKSTDPVKCEALPQEKRVTRADLEGSSGKLLEVGAVPPARFVSELDKNQDRLTDMKAPLESFERYYAPPRVHGCLIEGESLTAIAKASTEPTVTGDGFGLAEGAYNLADYAKACEAANGKIPSFNCLDGEVIPIKVDGVEATEIVERCDQPIWLGVGSGGRCKPFARLLSVDNGNPDVKTVVICRRYSRTTVDSPLFEDVAVVQHNTSTGDTCFFQMLDYAKKNATKVPSPQDTYADDPAVADHAKDFWLPFTSLQQPNMQCVRCHGNDAYMHTPYVDQLSVVPYQEGHEFGPYRIVAADKLGWSIPRSLASAKVETPQGMRENRCISCHRITQYATCTTWLDASTDHADQTAHGSMWRYLSDTGRKYEGKGSPWMPPHVGSMNLAKWKEQIAPHVKKVRECCTNPTAAGCEWEDHITN